MNNPSLWYLENIDLDKILGTDKEDAFLNKKNLVKYKKGDYIYLPSDSSDRVYFIKSGKIKIGNYRESDKEIVRAILHKGDVFGELAITGEEKRKDFAQASEEAEISVFTLDELKKLMKEHPAISVLIMKLMGLRTLEMENRLESLLFKDSKTRIIEFLILCVHKNGQRVGYEWVVRNFMTHQDIANLTATSRQTVTMVLNELRNQNIIQFDRKRLLIRDLDRLIALTK